MMHILLIRFKKITPGKTQVINRIEQIGFPNPVISINTDDRFVE
jgi:hypothetical protein